MLIHEDTPVYTFNECFTYLHLKHSFKECNSLGYHEKVGGVLKFIENWSLLQSGTQKTHIFDFQPYIYFKTNFLVHLKYMRVTGPCPRLFWIS